MCDVKIVTNDWGGLSDDQNFAPKPCGHGITANTHVECAFDSASK